VRVTRWICLLASSAALGATGCSSTTGGNGAASTTWHWPWSAPAQASAVGAAGAQAASASDPTSLAFRSSKPGPDLYVATARMYEKNGDAAGAAAQYGKALKEDPNHLPALLGYAALHDHQKEYGDADKLYQEAIKQHPKDAAVYNDRGLSYQSRGQMGEAAQYFAKAIQLQPDKPLYRNNMAIVLVAMHRHDEALAQLTAVHGPAVAHYNLAILLHRKGMDQEAQYHFAQAAQIDPSLVAAKQWAERLSPNSRPETSLAVQDPAGNQQLAAENAPPAMRRPVIISAPPGSPQVIPGRPTIVAAQPTQAMAGWPRPTLAPPQQSDAGQQQMMAMAQTTGPAMRYPQHAPVAVDNGAIPPSPDRISELPAAGDGMRPLPPVQ
jgi:Tfp pilus assembly protein PilF